MAESSFLPSPARVFHFLPIYMQSSRNNARLFKNLKTPSVWAMSVSERGRTRLPTEGKHSQELGRKHPGRKGGWGRRPTNKDDRYVCKCSASLVSKEMQNRKKSQISAPLINVH